MAQKPPESVCRRQCQTAPRRNLVLNAANTTRHLGTRQRLSCRHRRNQPQSEYLTKHQTGRLKIQPDFVADTKLLPMVDKPLGRLCHRHHNRQPSAYQKRCRTARRENHYPNFAANTKRLAGKRLNRFCHRRRNRRAQAGRLIIRTARR